jgi:hypothetical protein
VKSQETASHVTMGAVARMPKMIPNFRKSMMMSTPSVLHSRLEAYLSVAWRRLFVGHRRSGLR